MTYYGKTMLTCYNSIDKVVKQIENVIKKKALSSFYDYSSVEALCYKLILLSETRKDLIELKDIVDETLDSISCENKKLILYKYMGIMPVGEFDHTSRNYFRKQIKAMDKFIEKLSSFGYSEDWFKNKYMKIAFISNVYNKVVNEEGKKHYRLEC